MRLLTDTDLIRWTVVAELVLLLCTAAFLHGRYTDVQRDLPGDLRWRDRGLLSVVVVVALAVVVNALAGPMPTPGVFVVAVGVAPATLGGIWLTGRALLVGRRHRAAWTRESGDFLALVDRLEHAEPCPDPECVHARAELTDIARRLRT